MSQGAIAQRRNGRATTASARRAKAAGRVDDGVADAALHGEDGEGDRAAHALVGLAAVPVAPADAAAAKKAADILKVLAFVNNIDFNDDFFDMTLPADESLEEQPRSRNVVEGGPQVPDLTGLNDSQRDAAILAYKKDRKRFTDRNRKMALLSKLREQEGSDGDVDVQEAFKGDCSTVIRRMADVSPPPARG